MGEMCLKLPRARPRAKVSKLSLYRRATLVMFKQVAKERGKNTRTHTVPKVQARRWNYVRWDVTRLGRKEYKKS